MQEHRREAVSLETPIGDEGDSALGDFIEDADAMVAEDAVIFGAMQDELRAALESLDPREAQIVAMRYGLYDGAPQDAGGGGAGLRPVPRADPADRARGDDQAASPEPVPQPARLRLEISVREHPVSFGRRGVLRSAAAQAAS